MKSFKSFKDYIFTHLFPYEYKVEDTYKDINGKGILERFIDICSEYFDKEVIPEIDNFTDIIDIDKTPGIFLNYIWEYFGYIPYAYGVLVGDSSYSKENVYKWLNDPRSFPKADTRRILKYAISLYKIRCTEDFYTVLGRFYGVRFELKEVGSSSGNGDVSTIDLIIASYNNVYSTYDEIKAGWRYGDCWSCIHMIANIYIPKGMYDLLVEMGTLDDAKKALIEILNKYLPIHVKFFEDEDVTLIPDIPTILISAPPEMPLNLTSATIRISGQGEDDPDEPGDIDLSQFELEVQNTSPYLNTEYVYNIFIHDWDGSYSDIVVLEIGPSVTCDCISITRPEAGQTRLHGLYEFSDYPSSGSLYLTALLEVEGKEYRVNSALMTPIDRPSELVVSIYDDIYSSYEEIKSGY